MTPTGIPSAWMFPIIFSGAYRRPRPMRQRCQSLFSGIDDIITINENGGPGTVGPQGPIGPEGPIGPQGIQGPIGPQGIQGPIGPDGTQGIQGPIGPDGTQGIQGPIGPQGIQGPIGPQGIQGPIGPPGECDCCKSTLKTGNYTATGDDYYIGFLLKAAASLVLPENPKDCIEILAKLEFGAPVGNKKLKITTTDGSTIDGQASIVLDHPYEWLKVISRGGNWHIISEKS
jgi:hypothetical protein